MKVILVGASGLIGSHVLRLLSREKETEVVKVGFRSGDFSVDLADPASIRLLFASIGPFDALISATGKVAFKGLTEFSEEDWALGLQNKLMGQIRLVTEGLKSIRPGGSFTLTTGILNAEPIAGSVSAATVNGGIEAFVTAAANELSNGVRINCVSPTVLLEAMEAYGEAFKGFNPVPAEEVALAYLKSVAGIHTGRIYRVGW